MTEEQVTKAILAWLMGRGWHIVCFDFPQSGTGRVLHPDDAGEEKNKGSIIPDIVAVKEGTALFFENKDRFYLPDYRKLNGLMVDCQYTAAISALLSGYGVERIFYGVGLPSQKHGDRSVKSAHLVDFIVGVERDDSVSVLYDPQDILL